MNTATTAAIPADTFHCYAVWDRSTRWFHWINVLSVLGLIVLGTIILNGKALGVSSEGKILLKVLHVYVGYVFAFNLLWRLVWGFIGNRYARWAAILPIGRGYWQSVREYVASMRSQQPVAYAGHNPVGRLMVTALLLLLLAQAVTGLVLAGTDIYYPPLGNTVKTWIVADGSTPEQIVAGSKEHIDSARYQEMREFRKPFITVHVYAFYVLLLAILVHILAVVLTELRERNGLISAMFHGRKVFHTQQPPKDF